MAELRSKTQNALLPAVIAADAFLDSEGYDCDEDVREKLLEAINLAGEDYEKADKGGNLFAGAYYNPHADDDRLLRQLGRVFACISDGTWYTLPEIAEVTGDREASISAQLRHLRKARHGSWMVDVENQGGGLFGYRLRNPDGSKVPPIRPTLPGTEEDES